MAAAANDPGAASGVLAPPSCGVPSGTPRRSSLRLPLSLPGPFASLAMVNSDRLLATALETVDGHRVRVARLGAGPPLVLLHGYPENLQIWCEVAPRLAARFAVIAFDWPGMGFSEPRPGGKTPGHMAGRLLPLLGALQIERATI